MSENGKILDKPQTRVDILTTLFNSLSLSPLSLSPISIP